MFRNVFMRGVSAGVVSIAFPTLQAKAQESLPAIEIGAQQSASPTGPTDGPIPANFLPGGPNDPAAYSKPDTTTATKTDTPIMQTPFSVQIVPQQVLQDQQVVVLDQALQNVSAVTPVTNGLLQNGYNIRGFTTYEYYLDGVRVNTFYTPPSREMADIQQVEVLKGPASILYGRLEPGGLVNLVPKQPMSEPHAELQQQIGSYGFYRTTLDMTGPVTTDRSLLYRFDMAYENADSFRDMDHSYRIFVAPRLRWAPTQDTQVNLYAEFFNGRDPVDLGIPTVGNYLAPVPISRSFGAPDSALNTNSDLRVGYNWSHNFNKDWKITQRFDANYRDVPSMAVVPLGADPTNCTLWSCPVPRIINANPDVRIQNYFASADVTGRFETLGLSHELLAGADYYSNHSIVSNLLNFSTVPGTDLFSPVYTPNLRYLLATPDTATSGVTDQSWYGLYVQDQLTLPYDFHMLAGFRYDNATAGNYSLATIPAPPSESSSFQHETALKPRFGLLWQPIPQLSFYGDYVENFGLSNPQNPLQSVLPPTSARQWEAGVKTDLLDGRFMTTVAWFDIVKNNVATPSPDPTLAAQGIQVATGAVRNTGVEMDFKGQVTPELKVIGSYAMINSAIIADNGGNVGNRLFGVPRKSGSLWAVYEPQAHALKGLAFGAGLYGQTNVEIDNANSFTLPGYITVNMMGRYKLVVAGRDVTFQLNVNNMLNKGYYLASGSSVGIFPGAPRSFLGSLKVEF
ncbi:TonB-dependent siderophore receptor [Methylocystis heyeri]|uniref:TonB-dependent siderophore receptor n=1 Tax=Methylocystis heyeri TaxID=391905 RepID=A0A6B8KCX7_9HYPH|nr:TonB-dependent receptor [Methylocystis heyeri]QGM45452.1 TonB-dependent siderophore receptor [Methylocystis heyeri]